MDIELYRQAQDEFDRTLAAVAPSEWDKQSMCPDWSVRDVAGHVAWAQLQLRSWTTGEPDPAPDGAPGQPHPAVMAGDDPLATWRKARAEADAVLTEENLAKITKLPGIGEAPIAAVAELLICDLAGHTWDIGHALGHDVRLPAGVVTASHEWALTHAVRAPGFFGPELAPPPNADAQTRMLAYLGRA